MVIWELLEHVTWGMRFNAAKCNIIRVSRTCDPKLFNYSLTGQELGEFMDAEYLCFYIPQDCCCLPTPMTLASGGSLMFQFVVHQPASLSIWPAVQSLRRSLSTNPGVTMWCVCGCSWKDDVCRVCWCCGWGHNGDGCVLASTLCKYDLRKGDLFVLSWSRVRQVRRGSLSSVLLMCGGGVRSILLLSLVARCIWWM